MSGEAIRIARSLSDELALPATFIACDLYDLPQHLDATFDIVFTSYGVLTWLPDLTRWAELVARYLKPGGTFYLVEFYPFINMLDDDGRLARTYFPAGAEHYETHGSYADRHADFAHVSYEWTHSLGEVVSALIAAGLRLTFLHEFPYSPYDCFNFLEQRRDASCSGTSRGHRSCSRSAPQEVEQFQRMGTFVLLWYIKNVS